MHVSHALGAGAALAVFGWFLAASPAAPSAPTSPRQQEPLPAAGHYVLVVEGDRDALAITGAVAKQAPWAGVPKGFTSDWRLLIHSARGELLADVPLDVSAFAVGANDAGVRVEGCVVRDSRIGMLVNVPAFAAAASYTFTRPGGQGQHLVLGAMNGDTVRTLAGGGR